MTTLHLTDFYWNKTGFCGAAYNLTSRVVPTTHLSLPKKTLKNPRDGNWKDVGRFKARFKNMKNWRALKHGVRYSPRLQVYAQTLKWTAISVVQAYKQKTTYNQP